VQIIFRTAAHLKSNFAGQGLPKLFFVGNCMTVSYENEHESVLVLPSSGEVLICNTDAWNEVVESRILEGVPSDGFPFSIDAENLLATLDRMGVELA
jgi:hypothetical protein